MNLPMRQSGRGRQVLRIPLRLDIAIPRMPMLIGAIDPLAILAGNTLNEALAPFLVRPSYGREDEQGARTIFELRLQCGQGPEIPGPMGMPGFGLFCEDTGMLRVSGASTIVYAVANARPDLLIRGPERVAGSGIFPTMAAWLRPVVGADLRFPVGAVAITATFREATP